MGTVDLALFVIKKPRVSDSDLGKLRRSLLQADEDTVKPLLEPERVKMFLDKIEPEGTCEAACLILARLTSVSAGRAVLRGAGAVDTLLSLLLRQTALAKGEKQQDRMLAVGRVLALTLQDAGREDVIKVASGLVGILKESLLDFQNSGYRKTSSSAAAILIFLRFWSLSAQYAAVQAKAAAVAAACTTEDVDADSDSTPEPPVVVDKEVSAVLLHSGAIPLLILASRGAAGSDVSRRGIADNALLMVFHASLHHPEALTPQFSPGFDAKEFANFLIDTAAATSSVTTQVQDLLEHALTLLVRMGATLKLLPKTFLRLPRTSSLFRMLLQVKSPGLTAAAIISCGVLPRRSFTPLLAAYEHALEAATTFAVARLKGPFGESASYYYHWFGLRLNKDAKGAIQRSSLLSFLAKELSQHVAPFLVRLMDEDLRQRLTDYLGYDAATTAVDGSPVDPEQDAGSEDGEVDDTAVDEEDKLGSGEVGGSEGGPGGSTYDDSGARTSLRLSESGAGLRAHQQPGEPKRQAAPALVAASALHSAPGAPVPLQQASRAGPLQPRPPQMQVQRAPSQHVPGHQQAAGRPGTASQQRPAQPSPALPVQQAPQQQQQPQHTWPQQATALGQQVSYPYPYPIGTKLEGVPPRKRSSDGNQASLYPPMTLQENAAAQRLASAAAGAAFAGKARQAPSARPPGEQDGALGAAAAADGALTKQESVQSKRQAEAEAAQEGGDTKRQRRSDGAGPAAPEPQQQAAAARQANNALSMLAAAAAAEASGPPRGGGPGGPQPQPQQPQQPQQQHQQHHQQGAGRGNGMVSPKTAGQAAGIPPAPAPANPGHATAAVRQPTVQFTHFQLQAMMNSYQGLNATIDRRPDATDDQKQAMLVLAQMLSNVADVAEVKHRLLADHHSDINMRLDHMRQELQNLNESVTNTNGISRMPLEAKILRALSVMMKQEVFEQLEAFE